jgi:hypothetical protein
LPFDLRQQPAEDLGLSLAVSTWHKVDQNLDEIQAARLALQKSIRAIHASRVRITKTDALLARLWGEKEP